MLTRDELNNLFKATADEHQGKENREALAAELMQPLNQSVATESIARLIFAVDNIGPGAPASYPVEEGEVDAWIMPNVGQVPQNIIGGSELFVPTFEIASSASWKLQYAHDGRFNVMEREVARMKDAIVRQENASGWAVVTAATTAANTITTTETSLSKTLLNQLVSELEGSEGKRCDLIVVNPKDAAAIRLWAGNDLDDTTQREIWAGAGLGNIWGVDIVKSFDVTAGTAYSFDTSRFGAMPIRQEVLVFEDATAIRSLRVGYIGFEEVGFACADTDAMRYVDF